LNVSNNLLGNQRLRLLHLQFLRPSQHLRKNNFITQNNEIICSVRDLNDYRKYLHRMNTEINAAEKRVENVVNIDFHRLKISKSLFEKKYKNNEKFRAIYGCGKKSGNEENPIKYESVMETMRNRKLEKECQRKLKLDFE
jgi:hypothetical protein